MVFLVWRPSSRLGRAFAVILAVPFGIFGALTAIFRGFENDLYFQIGLVTLIGLSAKMRPDRRVCEHDTRQGAS